MTPSAPHFSQTEELGPGQCPKQQAPLGCPLWVCPKCTVRGRSLEGVEGRPWPSGQGCQLLPSVGDEHSPVAASELVLCASGSPSFPHACSPRCPRRQAQAWLSWADVCPSAPCQMGFGSRVITLLPLSSNPLPRPTPPHPSSWASPCLSAQAPSILFAEG